MNIDVLGSKPELAKRCNVSRDTVYQRRRTGVIPDKYHNIVLELINEIIDKLSVLREELLGDNIEQG